MKKEDLVLEVAELTELLRTSPNMAPLREALARQGVDSAKALLGSFYEDEESHEYGVVIRDDGMVFQYTRDTEPSDPSQFTTWRGIEDLARAVDECPQIEAALEMVRFLSLREKDPFPPFTPTSHGGAMKAAGVNSTLLSIRMTLGGGGVREAV